MLEIVRTNNAIKNHWNGTLKMRSDLYSPDGPQANMNRSRSPNFNSWEIYDGMDKVKVERESYDEMMTSPDCSIGLKVDNNTCFTELGLRNSCGGTTFTEVLSLKEGNSCPIKLVKLSSQIQHDETSGSSHKCNIKHANKCRVLIDSSSDVPMDVQAYSKLELEDHASNATKSGNSTRSLALADLALGIIPDNPYSSDFTLGLSGEADKVRNGNNSQKMQVCTGKINHDWFAYDQSKQQDLDATNNSNGFPSTYDHLIHSNSQNIYSTPTSFARAVYENGCSLESILRKSAMTFKNTPSIIRKRKSCTLVSTGSSDVYYAEEKDVDSTDFSSFKKTSLFCRPSNTSVAVRSLERCLEYDFDFVT